MASGDPLTTRVDESIHDDIDRYQDAEGYEDRSEAIRDVIRAGVREKQGPVREQWREMALSAAYHFALVSVMLIIIGFGTSMLPAGRAVALSMVVMTMSVAPVAAVEIGRVVGGQNELADLWGGE